MDLSFLTEDRRNDLFEHQREYLEAHCEDEYWGLMWQTGAAKTLPILANAAHLFLKGEVEVLVVFAPNTVHTNWVNREVPKTLHPKFPVVTYAWDGRSTKASEQQRVRFIHVRGKLKIVAVNIEALSAKASDIKKNRAVLFLADLIKAHEGKVMGVVDESHDIGDPASSRTRRALKFSKLFRYRRIASGTPLTESPLAIFSQSEFLKPGVLGFDSYDLFTLRYAVKKRQKFGKGKSFEAIVGYQNLEELRKKVSEFCSFKKKSECMDLPPKLYETRSIQLTEEQKEAYAQMRVLNMHTFRSESGEDLQATAKSAMRKLALLHDIVLGYTRIADPTYTPPPGKPPRYIVKRLPSNRIHRLVEELKATEGKVIVFSECIPALLDIQSALTKEFGEGSSAVFYGATESEERERIIDQFQDETSKLRFFVANAQTAGTGLTLTAASTVVFFSNGYRLRLRLQAEDRPHRPGQKHPVTYIDFVAPGTVDEKIFRAYESKVDVASQVVPLFDYFMGEAVGDVDLKKASTAPENGGDLFPLFPEVDVPNPGLDSIEAFAQAVYGDLDRA